MKRIILLIVTAFAFSFAARAQTQWPDVKVENLKGETVSTKSLMEDGVPAIVLFWSTTCKPCLMEMDAISNLYDEWQEVVEFKVIAVSTDDSRASSKAVAMARGNDWPFTVVLDRNQDLKRAMNVNAIPQMFILDKDGNIVHSHAGYIPGGEYDTFEKLRKLAK